MYIRIKEKLMTGQPVLAGGSWGSELTRRGLSADELLWTSPANLSHGEAVREIARAYLRAGADMIVANTFSTGPLLMNALGRLDEMEEMDRAAIGHVRAVLDEETESPVALAGSFSIAGPRITGGDDMPQPGLKEMRALFDRKAETLAKAGCDMIYMERMGGLERSELAVEAAVATGLPVWVELAVERAPDGSIHGVGSRGWSLEDMAASLMNTDAQACLVNHGDPAVLADALETVKFVWAGAQGVSLRNGHCEPPLWRAGGLNAEDFAIEARRWRQQGAGIFSATSGAGPEFVAAARETFHLSG